MLPAPSSPIAAGVRSRGGSKWQRPSLLSVPPAQQRQLPQTSSLESVWEAWEVKVWAQEA